MAIIFEPVNKPKHLQHVLGAIKKNYSQAEEISILLSEVSKRKRSSSSCCIEIQCLLNCWVEIDMFIRNFYYTTEVI